MICKAQCVKPLAKKKEKKKTIVAQIFRDAGRAGNKSSILRKFWLGLFHFACIILPVKI